MTPTLMAELAAVDALVRTVCGTMDVTKAPDAERFALLLEAAARLSTVRQALHEIARAPVPDAMREPARCPARLRVIEGGR